MKISSQRYQISIDKIYGPLKSEDLNLFDYVFDPKDHITDEFHSAFSIKIESTKKTLTVGLIGSFFANNDQCAVLDGSILTVLMDNEIFVLDIESISLIRHTSIGDEPYFAIYPIENGFIIHGELTILRLNKDFDQVWQFSGSDIFATPDVDKETFAISNDKIFLEDWNGYKFILDLDGNLLQETKPKS